MPRTLRVRDPNYYRLITIRTRGAELWLIPSRNIEKLLGGILARYSEILGIEVYAYCFLSNHYHLVIRAPRGNADEFCENINREISRRINWKYHRSGALWGCRYADQHILSEEDLLEAFLYVTTNPVKHGLVDHPSKWPGLCSYQQSVSGHERRFTFHYYSADNPEERSCKHTLRLTPLPGFSDLPDSKRRAILHRFLEERIDHLAQTRKASGEGFLERIAILTQRPGSTPRSVAKSPRPRVYTKDALLRKEAIRQQREQESFFKIASMRFRLGDLSAIFPEFMYKPSLHRKPRAAAFIPLPDDYFQHAA